MRRAVRWGERANFFFRVKMKQWNLDKQISLFAESVEVVLPWAVGNVANNTLFSFLPTQLKFKK